MARICARCRLPVGRVADDHVCLDDDEPDSPAQDDGTDGEDHLTANVSGSVTTERDLLDRLQERFA